MRTADEIFDALGVALRDATADELEVRYGFERRLATRFGENAITQNSDGAEETVTITACFGRREGSFSTNSLDASALRLAVEQAETIARAAPENEEHVALPPPQTYPSVPPSAFEATAHASPRRLAEGVRAVTGAADSIGYKASGLMQAVHEVTALANSNGLLAHHERTQAMFSSTVHGPTGSAKEARSHPNIDALNAEAMASRVLDRAAQAQGPRPIEPGDYTVVFEPMATGALLAFLVFTMSARDAAEGTTPFAGQVGRQIAAELVTLRLPIDDHDVPAPPFGSAGLASRPVTWIDRGVLARLHHDRYWATRTSRQPDPLRVPLVMDGEDRTVDDLVRQCERGLLVRNLWYIRFVDRRSLLLTGMTRDGLFRIADGRVVEPVTNLRWNESPLAFLSRAVALGRPEIVGDHGWMKLPGVLSDAFTFTSTTDSI
jgi:predicted Zn-dependent protease